MYTLLDTAVNINIQQSASYFPAREQKGIPMNLLKSRARFAILLKSRVPLSVADPDRVRSQGSNCLLTAELPEVPQRYVQRGKEILFAS